LVDGQSRQWSTRDSDRVGYCERRRRGRSKKNGYKCEYEASGVYGNRLNWNSVQEQQLRQRKRVERRVRPDRKSIRDREKRESVKQDQVEDGTK
jgi:hypothetical protein